MGGVVDGGCESASTYLRLRVYRVSMLSLFMVPFCLSLRPTIFSFSRTLKPWAAFHQEFQLR